MNEEAITMAKPVKEPARRVRFVLCPDCGVPTPKGRNEPHDDVSVSQCYQCFMVFESTHLPSWLAWPDPLTGGVRDDD